MHQLVFGSAQTSRTVKALAFRIALFPHSPPPLIRSESLTSLSFFRFNPRFGLTRINTEKSIKASLNVSSETIASASSSKKLPAHLSHLSEMFISNDAEVGHHILDMDSSLRPLIHELIFEDWVALLLDLGENDFSISLKILHSLKGFVSVGGSGNQNERMEPVVTKKDSSKESRESDEGLKIIPELDQGSNEKRIGIQGSGTDFDGDSVKNGGSDPAPEILSSSSILRMYTSLVKALARNKRFEDVEKLQVHMKKDSVEPDCDFYDVLLKSYAYEGLLVKVSEVLEVMKKAGFQPSQFTYEKVAFAYIKQDTPNMTLAMDTIKEMMEKELKINVGLLKNLMKCYWTAKDVIGAEAVLKAMQDLGHTPDLKIFFKVVQLHGHIGNHKRIVELMDHMSSKWGIQPNSGFFDSLLIAYCKASLMDEAKETFLKYKEVLNIKPTLVAYNVLIHGYGKQGLHKEAVEIFEGMRQDGYKPTDVTYNSIISTMARAEDFKKAAQLLRRMKREGGLPTVRMYVDVIRCFTKCNMTREGHKLFNSMKNASSLELTEGAYGAGMVMYVEGHWYRQAATLLETLEREKIPLDALAQASLIRSFGILECERNPLSKSVKERNFQICKLLTSLFISGSKENPNPESKVEPKVESELSEALYTFLDKCDGSQKEIYNAFLDCFWKKGYRNFTRKLLNHAKGKGFLDYTQPQLDELKWTLDVRGLSVGGAKAVISDGLLSISTKEVQEILMVEIITGNEFKLEVIQDNRYVKGAISRMLKNLNSPFVDSSNDSKKVEARAVDVVAWLSKEEVKEAMGFSSLVH